MAFIGLVGLVGLVGIAGCSSNAASPAPQRTAQAVCPATPDETVGAACSVPGLRCGPQYTCGALSVSLLCVCTDGVFQCTDGAGQPIANGATPTCSVPMRSGSCPSTEGSAQLTSCTEPGLLCAYPSACPGRFDPCQCSSGQIAGGYGLRFECTPVTCSLNDGGASIADSSSGLDSGPAIDSTTPADASGDSRSDAPPLRDSSTESDTATGDARPE